MRDHQYPGRSVAMGTRGMVATSHALATQAGLSVLQQGGNAMDAAIAASAVQCVVEPQSTGVGGDCFLLYHEARTGKLHGLNGSGRAPARATPEEYCRRGLDAVPEHGILALTVPGAIDAWEVAIKRFGTRSLGEMLTPAITFAEDGYPVTPVVGKVWKQFEPLLAEHPDAARALLVNGGAPAPGTRHRQPMLARTLREIAKHGGRAFYEGAIAEQLVAFSRAEDGLLEMDDLAAHRSDWVEPIMTDYRGVRVYEIPPNGQGITTLMMLNIIENADVSGLAPLGAERVHLMLEAFRLAVAERDRFVADPAFHPAPVAQLLDKAFARAQYARIDPQRALPHPVPSGLTPKRDTIYLCVVDRDGNAVSFINSLYYPFGSGLVAGETGVTLQNRGGCFRLEEGHANCIAPRKRPMHTIIPAMAFRDDKPLLAFGVMGGDFQAMGQAWVFSNWLDCGMDLQEAIDAPRCWAGGGVASLERPLYPLVQAELARRGHSVAVSDLALGGGQAILIDHGNGVLQAGSDPRKDGCALGY